MTTVERTFIEVVERLRREKTSPLTFVQLGAFLGNTPANRDDFANKALKYEDIGVFVEPHPTAFPQLLENNKEYVNATFVNKAIIPVETCYKEYFHLSPQGAGSTFVRGAQYGADAVEDFTAVKVDTLTVKEFLDEHVKFPLDIFLSDCEGYDNGIVSVLLDYIQPKVIVFESWDMSFINNCIESTGYSFTTRQEVLEKCHNLNYTVVMPTLPAEDILCYKL